MGMTLKARASIKAGQPTMMKLRKMMRRGRENFAMDIVSERNRAGMRAFKYRSGQRDLRNLEPDSRRRKRGLNGQLSKGVKWRAPDHKRKRHRWGQGMMKSKGKRWNQLPSKYKKT